MINIQFTYTDESVMLKPEHVYRCPRCRKCWLGREIGKQKHDGKRHCPECWVYVLEDVTDTPAGIEYLQAIKEW